MSQGIVIEYTCNGQRYHVVHLCGANDTPAECVQAAADKLEQAEADCNQGTQGEMPANGTGDYVTNWDVVGGKKARVESTEVREPAHDALVAAAQAKWPVYQDEGGPQGN